MPFPLQHSMNIQQIKEWIFNNASTQSPIIPIAENLDIVPKTKGIYFWFMKPDCYKELSKLIEIKAIEPRIEDKNEWHLVYIGIAGILKEEKSELHERLDWHIKNHSVSSIGLKGGNPSLSTFRHTIGCLLSNDLIEDNTSSTNDKIKECLKKYFKVYWIEYSEPNLKQLLKKDEELLISKVYLPFNLPKGRLPKSIKKGIFSNSKDELRFRRFQVLENTRNRIGSLNGSKSMKENQKNLTKLKFNNLDYSLYFEKNNTIIVDSNGAKVPNMKDLLRNVIREAPLPIQIIKTNGIEKTTKELAKELAKYYELEYKDLIPKTPISNKMPHIFIPSKLGCKTLIILYCSGSKLLGGAQLPYLNDFFQIDNSFESVEFRNIRKEIVEELVPHNPNELLPAYKRYSGNRSQLYQNIIWENVIQKHNEGKLELIMLSAKFGVLEYFANIPWYDNQINETHNLWGNSISNVVEKYIEIKRIKNIFNCVSKDYAGLLPNIPSTPLPQGSYKIPQANWVNSIVNAL